MIKGFQGQNSYTQNGHKRTPHERKIEKSGKRRAGGHQEQQIKKWNEDKKGKEPLKRGVHVTTIKYQGRTGGLKGYTNVSN